MPFDVTLEGLTECKIAISRAIGVIETSVARGVRTGVKEGAAEARRNHTFKNRTGELEKSIKGIDVGWVSGDRYQGIIVASAKHAKWVEEGTAAHMIAANKAQALHFIWKGVPVFFRYVNHPGTKPMPFMHLAYYKCERVIIREVEIGIAKAAEILAR